MSKVITGKQFRSYLPCLLVVTSISIMIKHCFKIKKKHDKNRETVPTAVRKEYGILFLHMDVQ